MFFDVSMGLNVCFTWSKCDFLDGFNPFLWVNKIFT